MQRYFNPRILAIMLLGMSSGLPRALVGGTLSAWLAQSGVDKASIGLFAYVAVPYSFKFVWSPLMDQLPLGWLTRRFGQRVGWMLLTQISLIIGLLGMATIDPAHSARSLAMLAIAVAFFSASQDVVIDAYRAEYLTKDHYGEGAAVAVFGYRVGLLISGAGALIMIGWLGDSGAYEAIHWRLVYIVMAGLVGLGMLTALIAGEPKIEREAFVVRSLTQWLEHAVYTPFKAFASSHPQWRYLLLFIALYRAADGFIGFMTNPYYLEMGFTLTQIGSIAKLYGFIAAIAGGFLGAAGLNWLGMYRALWWFGIAQLASNLIYLLLLSSGPQLWALMIVISVENLAAGAVGAVAVAFLMQLCDLRYTATQYALLSSLAALSGTLLAGPAGYVAQQFGWSVMFVLSSLIGLPVLLLLYKLRRHPVFSGLSSTS
ncbi:MAG: MFS transporter [Rickettsiales bacterium]|nr:MFS transporter [Rickettsiales bacterium]